MGIFIRVLGLKDKEMEKVYISRKIQIHIIKEIGKMGKNKVMEFRRFLINSFMKENSIKMPKMDLEFKSMQIMTFIKDIIKTENLTDRANIFGLMDQFIQAISYKTKDLDSVDGYQV